MSKCIYCYREEGTHNHDPILLPNGAKYKWSDSSETTLEEVSVIDDRIYKGFYQITEEDITELQSELAQLEIDNGITPLTIFSPINNTGKFQVTGYHIKEMRDSVEKLLTALGLTKIDYFNYDEDGNHIIHPLGDKIEWIDPITEATELIKFQVKYIHIEDLRHFIQLLWQENWEDSIEITYNLLYPPQFLGQNNKTWYALRAVTSGGTAYLQITNVKDAYLYMNGGSSTLFTNFCRVSYLKILNLTDYSLKISDNLEFDINLINIPNISPLPFFSQDCFFITLEVKSILDSTKFAVQYAFNYDAPSFSGFVPETEDHLYSTVDFLKGDISVGSQVLNVYSDFVAKYGASFTNYYDGTLDTQGMRVEEFTFGIQVSRGTTTLHEVKIDNLKLI